MKIKKLLATLVFVLMSFVLGAQNDTTQNTPSLSPKDSLVLMNVYDIVYSANKSALPRYKMYQTDNIYNLIKLDTATGRIWQVQYRMQSTEAMVVPIDDTSLLHSWEKEIPGRYELYPTKNIYTFILLDTVKGYVYQVQWSTKGPDSRFREMLYLLW